LKLNGLKDLMNMVIHDLRNPATLIDSNLDNLAELIGLKVVKNDTSPRNNIKKAPMLVNSRNLSNFSSPKVRQRSPSHGTGGTGEESFFIDGGLVPQNDSNYLSLLKQRPNDLSHSEQIEMDREEEKDFSAFNERKRADSDFCMENKQPSYKSELSCFTFNQANQEQQQNQSNS
jgi:hypothetical protein